MKQVEKYTLSQKRLNTVKSYAREYPDWIKQIAYMTHVSSSQRFGDQKNIAKGAGRPTENLALRRVQISKKIDMIEKTAREVDPFIYKYLIKGVTEGVPYEKLFSSGITCSRNTYYTRRRMFYWKLSEKMYRLGV